MRIAQSAAASTPSRTVLRYSPLLDKGYSPMKSCKDGTTGKSNEKQSHTGAHAGRQIRWLEVETLNPHPKQAELVGDMRAADFELFVADVKEKGIQNALVIMADRQTIVCGHQRHRAARELGFETVPCIVRTDLIEPDDPAVIDFLLNDNLQRRQLTPLEKAHYAKTLAEIEYRRRVDPEFRIDSYEQVAVREAVGHQLGMSGRNVDRYLAILRTPESVQRAFSEGLLPLALTAQIAFVRSAVREKLASAIEKWLSRLNEKNVKSIKSEMKKFVKSELAKAKPKKARIILPPKPHVLLYELKQSVSDLLASVRSNFQVLVENLSRRFEQVAAGRDAAF